jgi:putative MATE family efflux protein
MTLDKTQNQTLIKNIMAMTLPIALQNLITFSLNLLDILMIGRLGENDIAAAGLANQPFFIFSLLIYGIASGATILTAQYYGKGDKNIIKRVITLSLWVSLFITAIVAALIYIFPENVMGFYTDKTVVIELGASYLKYTSISYLFTAISGTYLGIVVSVGNPYLPLKINCFAIILNTFFNYIFIFGKLGAPAMGIAGAGLATLISRIIEFMIVIWYLFFIDTDINLRLKDFLHFDKLIMLDMAKYSIPVVANEILWGAGISMYSVVIGHMSSAVIAAYNISMVMERLCSAYILGLCKASAILLGEQLGQGNKEKALMYSHKMIHFAAFTGAISGIIAVLTIFIIPLVFKIGYEAQKALVIIMIVMGVNVVINAVNSTNIVSILRSGGDTAFATFIDVSFIWLAALPLSYYCAKLGYPLLIVMLAMKTEEFIKLILGTLRVKQGKWLKNLTR